jgi:hypothetical protein
MGHNYRTIHFFCEGLSLSPRTHAIRGDTADMLVFTFMVRADAQKFLDRFGGELIDSSTRPRPSRRTATALQHRQQNGRCINCDD